ncbi:MAG: thiamine phosphate synthase [Opitutae bacterium]|nr:thiamine phosphate synthase [Opitutae bacterium]MBT5909205.1 thiamine phosphate synthase [Opitutae bacterium]MBT7743529.1 thiamine phosphate synthase [Opitutae bacterium]MBT7924691.1 thiamine phosphate synthase [Opitutae bacterium]
MEVILISSPSKKKNEVSTIRRIFEMGLSRFHVRKPDWSLDEVRKFLDEFPDECIERTVIHRRPELLSEYPFAGYHLSSKEQYLAKEVDGTISRSFHQLDELITSQEKLDYVFLGPIFDSVSKQGYNSAFPASELRSFFVDRRKLRVDLPRIVALGGIVPEKVRVSLSLGFDGVAALGGVWGSRYPQKAFMRYRTAIPSRSGSENSSWLEEIAMTGKENSSRL